MSIENLHRAVSIMGGQTGTAKMLSAMTGRPLAQAHIWNWLNSPNPDMMPPAEYCPAIERATIMIGSPVRCEDLRPDVDWAVLRTPCSNDEAAHDERGLRQNEMQEAA